MSTFVDRVVLNLRAGNGGNGCVSVKREKFKPLAGPDGGNGGHGGDIILVSDNQVTTLLSYHRGPHRSADHGSFGMGDNKHGARGENMTLTVPVGTIVRDTEGNELIDMDEDGMTYVAAEGGVGGLGNNALASNKRKAPGFSLLGTPGWEGQVILELKTMADVALVGFPSAGKSSLIAAVSQAKPKIADYPFTTLRPNLGVVEAGSNRFTVADVPGLIEGASEGKGLGLEFLRHIERCHVIVHVIDCATLESDRDPMSDFDVIRHELGKYDIDEGMLPLLDRPQIVVLNKADVPEALELAEMVKPDFEALGFETFIVSAVARTGLQSLNYRLAEIVEKHRQEILAAKEIKPKIVIKTRGARAPFTVTKEGTSEGTMFRIRGAKPELWVMQTDFNNEEAIGFLADRLNKIGIDAGLFRAGAEPGAGVIIGRGTEEMVFDWDPTLTSAAEVMSGPRGTDGRFNFTTRKTRQEKREEYTERMDAKEAARQLLEEEKKAGIWRDPEF